MASCYKLMVLSQPVAGREDEYHRWYEDAHMRQMLALPGVKSAQRFRLARGLGERHTWPYLAIYEVETDDIDGVLQELSRRAGGEHLVISDALAKDSVYAAVYEALAPAVVK
ncbi:MAG: hypothetical protein P4L83_13440 [Nevskia sp.]|nr:hypothetical protein [Nevskia sp.]